MRSRVPLSAHLICLVLLLAPGSSEARYRQADPLGLDAGSNRFPYAPPTTLLFIDPDGLQTVVVINNNAPVVGSHAGVIVGKGRDSVLYDPAGTDRIQEKGSGDALYGRLVNLDDYIDYQRRDGPDVEVLRFDTTPAQEELIKKRIEELGGAVGGMCARHVSEVLRGIGPFRDLGVNWTPSGLARALRGLRR